MNSHSRSSATRALGTWIDVPSESVRVFVPFGKTRLNTLGLFYFRQHFYKQLKTKLKLSAIHPVKESPWIYLGNGRRGYVAPTTIVDTKEKLDD